MRNPREEADKLRNTKGPRESFERKQTNLISLTGECPEKSLRPQHTNYVILKRQCHEPRETFMRERFIHSLIIKGYILFGFH